MRVAAITVAWNSATQLPGCLGALDRQTHPRLEVVVVDNGSSDGSAGIARAWATRTRLPARVVANADNRGFCGGVNAGIGAVSADVDAVLLVNPDVVATPTLVSELVDALTTSPRVGSVQPRLWRPGADRVIDTTGHVLTSARVVLNRGEGEPDRGQYEQPGPVFGVSGACALHRRAMLEDVAWRSGEVLTEQLFAYHDDVELDWRARCLGWEAVYAPRARAVHERGGAQPGRSAHVEALSWSNRLLVLATCDQLRAAEVPLVALTTALKTLELALTRPRALPTALARLRLVGGARRRRRELLARARLPPAMVAADWARPFRWRPWVAAWWRRARARATAATGPRRRPDG